MEEVLHAALSAKCFTIPHAGCLLRRHVSGFVAHGATTLFRGRRNRFIVTEVTVFNTNKCVESAWVSGGHSTALSSEPSVLDTCSIPPELHLTKKEED